MNEKDLILNVKLPFIEAVEYLTNETDYVGIISIDGQKVIYVDGGNLIPKSLHSSVNITVKDILNNEWYLVLRNKNKINKNN